MRIALITGTRDDVPGLRDAVWPALDVFKPHLVIHGAASGADDFALGWCIKRGVDQYPMGAVWAHNDKSREGKERNACLVAVAKVRAEAGHEVKVFAFPSPSSRGTWDCVRQAKAAGLTGVVRKVGGK